jgi:hypothetical protein
VLRRSSANGSAYVILAGVPPAHHFSSPAAFAAAVRREAPMRARRLWMEHGLAAAGRRGTPVLVGPWVSEIGFELLYWIPLLRRLLEHHGVAPGQVTAISRGGVGDWYLGVADHYVDIHDLVGLDEFRAAQAARVASAGDQKQLSVTAWDRRLRRAAAPAGAHWIHPLAMYSRLRYVWGAQAGVSELLRRCDYRRIPPPPEPGFALPERFVAAKPYFSDVLPDDPANRDAVRSLLLGVAEETDVVLLSTGLDLDEHAEPELIAHPRIHTLAERLRPSDNLAVQTRVMARSGGLLATYGGPSYLAGFLGLPSISLATTSVHNPRHLEAAGAAAQVLGAPAPALLDPRAPDALERSLQHLAPVLT